METISFAHLDMRADAGFGANNGNADSNSSAMAHLEALLRAIDDDEEARDLDLAMSIIQDLDVSLLKPQLSSTTTDHPEELLMLQALYPGNSLSSDASFTKLLTTATSAVAAGSLVSPARAKRKDKKCTYQNRRVRTET